jgi:hypothetical protein
LKDELEDKDDLPSDNDKDGDDDDEDTLKEHPSEAFDVFVPSLNTKIGPGEFL